MSDAKTWRRLTTSAEFGLFHAQIEPERNESHLVLGSVRMFSKLFILLRSFFLSENTEESS